jgi:hypothetical protein
VSHAPRVRSLFLILVLCALTSVPVFAQMETATLSGAITDPNGRVVPDVEVSVTRIETGTLVTTKTNGAGIYVFTGLMPGHYHLMIHKPGFKEIAIKEFQLAVQDKLEQNFSLEIGSVSETVTVTAAGLNVNTTDAAVSTVVDHQFVQEMPLNGRSFQDLILLTPGVVPSPLGAGGGLGASGEFSVNGQRTEENYYTVDGVSANVGSAAGANFVNNAGPSGSVPGATALGTTQALVSVDDLQEFRVQSSTYSAEYGRSPGGQFAFETKSGTNQWHGSAYDYLRNGVFDANDWFNDYLGVKEAALRQNDFGGTLGGPVEIPHVYSGIDKTFFFVSYEGLRLAQPQAATPIYVPDLCMRGMGDCPTSGPGAGRGPAASALLPVVNSYPLPSPNGIADPTDGVAQFLGTWSNPASIDSTSVRLDHSINDKVRLFFRFSDTLSSSDVRASEGGNSNPADNLSSKYTSLTFTGGVSTILSGRTTNDFRLNYSSNQNIQAEAIGSFGGNTPVDLAQIGGLGVGSFPRILFLAGSIPTPLIVDQYRQSGAQRQWNLVDATTLSVGRHQLKFGIDFRRLTPTATPYDPQVEYVYVGEPSLETNNTAVALAQSFGAAHPLYINFSTFVQDQWRATSRLTLSFGLRWEVNPAPGVTAGLKPYTVEGSGPSTFTLAPQGTPLWKTTWANLAPRLGAAYVLRDNPSFETVIRGGAGVFYDTGQQLGSQGFQGPGYSALFEAPGAAFPLPASQTMPPIVNPPVPPYSAQVYAFASDLQLPYTIQWNASVEQALGRSQAFTISYVGSHAAKLLEQKNIDGAALNNPNISSLYFVQNGLTSDYNALQLQFQRTLSRGLTALASYTWSHCLDYGSENLTLPYQRGNCDFDIRHNFSAAVSYELPSAGENGFVKAMLSHWALDDRFTARTALPVTLLGSPSTDPISGQIYNAGLNLVPGEPTYIYGSQCAAVYDNGLACPGGRAINPNAFQSPPGITLGNAPRNFARGFGAWQMDFAVRREFPIYENLRLQFRAEAFNIFNHPNFGIVDAGFGDPTFGQAIHTLASSSGILSPLYQQGGPRSMQFALKLIF